MVWDSLLISISFKSCYLSWVLKLWSLQFLTKLTNIETHLTGARSGASIQAHQPIKMLMFLLSTRRVDQRLDMATSNQNTYFRCWKRKSKGSHKRKKRIKTINPTNLQMKQIKITRASMGKALRIESTKGLTLEILKLGMGEAVTMMMRTICPTTSSKWS